MAIKFVDELPPQRRGKRPRRKHVMIAAALRNNPGEWALVMRNASPSTATAIGNGTLAAYRPAGAYEARSRANGYKAGNADIYARYVGEPEPKRRGGRRA